MLKKYSHSCDNYLDKQRIPDADAIKTPMTILKEQASLLKQKTNGLLEGAVRIHRQELEDQIAVLEIVAPVLGNYSIGIVQIKYGLHFYPVRIVDSLAGVAYDAIDEISYKIDLEKIFTSRHVQETIKTLIQQVKSINMP